MLLGVSDRKHPLRELLDMMLHHADESARTYRRLRPVVVTEAVLEAAEWEAFKAQVKRGKLVGAFDDRAPIDVEEEDVDLLLAVVVVLERAHERGQGLTLAEVVRELQRDGVLSVEFVAAARGQAQRLLTMLIAVGRAQTDRRGMFFLARDW